MGFASWMRFHPQGFTKCALICPSLATPVHHLQHLSITCNTCASLATRCSAEKRVANAGRRGRYDKIWVSGSVTQTVAELCKAVEEAAGGSLKCTAVTGPEQKIQCEKTDVCAAPHRATCSAQRTTRNVGDAACNARRTAYHLSAAKTLRAYAGLWQCRRGAASLRLPCRYRTRPLRRCVVAGRCVGCSQFAARALQRAAAGDQEELDSAVGSAAQCIDAAVRAVPCRAVPCRAVPCRAVPCRACVPARARSATRRRLRVGVYVLSV